MPVGQEAASRSAPAVPSVQENSDGRSWLPAFHRFSARTEHAVIPRRTIPNVIALNAIARIQIAYRATPPRIWSARCWAATFTCMATSRQPAARSSARPSSHRRPACRGTRKAMRPPVGTRGNGESTTGTNIPGPVPRKRLNRK